ncbi:hypothetical protein Tco_0371394 [Tanacetum coccineum]
MTRSTVKKLEEPLNEPKRELHRRRKAASRQQWNESLAIAGRNLFNDETSSVINTETIVTPPIKSLREYSSPNFAGFQNPIIFLGEQKGRIWDSQDIWLIQGMCTFQGLESENPIHHVRHFLSLVDNIQADGAIGDASRLYDSWDDLPLPMNISSISEIIKPTLEGRLRKACEQLSNLTTSIGVKNSRNPYLICDIYGGAHKVDECNQNGPHEQVYLSRGDIYDDPSLLRFYQNDDILLWGNVRRRTKGEEGPEWVVKSKFEDNLSNFMLDKDLHAKGLGEMLNQQQREMHNRFSQILSTFRKGQKPTL